MIKNALAFVWMCYMAISAYAFPPPNEFLGCCLPTGYCYVDYYGEGCTNGTTVLTCSPDTCKATVTGCPPGYSEPVPPAPDRNPSPNDPGGTLSDCYLAYVAKMQELYNDYLMHIESACEHEGNCYKEPCINVWNMLYSLWVDDAYASYLLCVSNSEQFRMQEPCPNGWGTVEPEPVYPAPSPFDPGAKDGGYSDCYIVYVAMLEAAYNKYVSRVNTCIPFPGMDHCYRSECLLVQWTYYLLEVEDAKVEYEWCILSLDR